MRRPMIGICLFLVACASTTPPPQASRVSLLYVQTAASGSFEQLPGTNKYRLVLSDVSPRVIYFADRPNRIAGQVSTAEFLDKIGFGGPLDPNAAIEIAEGTPDSDLVIAALSKPAYHAQAGRSATRLPSSRRRGKAWPFIPIGWTGGFRRNSALSRSSSTTSLVRSPARNLSSAVRDRNAAVTQVHQFAGGEIDDRAIWFRTA
jgi:hypothetical protein